MRTWKGIALVVLAAVAAIALIGCAPQAGC